MLTCPQCGAENREAARFCDSCGAVLAPPTATREQRKVVTVLFCDVVGSTALGESTDPEALRPLLARYFERMKQIVERHGGTVEKFIGDAVMAVFGIPVLHEDDALRALRAAVEMREAFPELGIEGRIGVTTGEVVTGTEERLATGDAVNVAARLEQAAQPGEILIGQETLRLAGSAVEVEPLEPLTLKGKAEPTPAYRLLAARPLPDRRHETLFVGRERELAALADAWRRVQAEERCELATIVSEAGVGKTRLVAEALARLEAVVVRGRCLSYGEGITYWPVVEVVKHLDALPSDRVAAAAIRSLLGETEAGTSAEEIAWAFRKLLDEVAEKHPLVVVFEDIHWGEETFLDLIEHVALLSAGVPILLLCTARPELVDRRPGWPVTFRLAPLNEHEVRQLIPEQTSEQLRRRIVRAAGGNPLFVWEMVAMADDTEGEVSVPPTLRALLAARLDGLAAAERLVLERGAVEGEIFHRGAVQTLAPEELQVTARLAALVRRELVRPERPQIPGEDGFRFRHLLIRDAAYEALPKAVRAELHTRFAGWLEERGAELIELDEIVGYHLEQAARYRSELGQPDRALAERASERLASTGRRALWRGDRRAAVGLLTRALTLSRPLRLDVPLELDLADAQGNPRESATIADAAAERAQAGNDPAGAALARTLAALYRMQFSPNPSIDELEACGRAAVPMLEQAGDHAGLTHVWRALGSGAANFHGRFDEWAHASQQAIHYSRLAFARDPRLFDLPLALAIGLRPADEALKTLDAVLPENPHPHTALVRTWLVAMLGRFDEAWAIAREARARLRELDPSAWADYLLAEIATLEEDYEAAEQLRRQHCELLQQQGNRPHLSTYGALLGRTLCALERYEEAEQWAELGHELGDERDLVTQALWRQVQALVDSSRGELSQAQALAREAVVIIESTDALTMQGDAFMDLAEVLRRAARQQEAAQALEQALARYERKKNLPRADQARAKLAELHAL